MTERSDVQCPLFDTPEDFDPESILDCVRGKIIKGKNLDAKQCLIRLEEAARDIEEGDYGILLINFIKGRARVLKRVLDKKPPDEYHKWTNVEIALGRLEDLNV